MTAWTLEIDLDETCRNSKTRTPGTRPLASVSLYHFFWFLLIKLGKVSSLLKHGVACDPPPPLRAVRLGHWLCCRLNRERQKSESRREVEPQDVGRHGTLSSRQVSVRLHAGRQTLRRRLRIAQYLAKT